MTPPSPEWKKEFREKFKADFFWESEAWEGQTRRGAIESFIESLLAEKEAEIERLAEINERLELHKQDEKAIQRNMADRQNLLESQLAKQKQEILTRIQYCGFGSMEWRMKLIEKLKQP